MREVIETLSVYVWLALAFNRKCSISIRQPRHWLRSSGSCRHSDATLKRASIQRVQYNRDSSDQARAEAQISTCLACPSGCYWLLADVSGRKTSQI